MSCGWLNLSFIIRDLHRAIAQDKPLPFAELWCISSSICALRQWFLHPKSYSLTEDGWQAGGRSESLQRWLPYGSTPTISWVEQYEREWPEQNRCVCVPKQFKGRVSIFL